MMTSAADRYRPPIIHRGSGLTVRGTNAQAIVYRDGGGSGDTVVGAFRRYKGRYFYQMNAAHGGSGFEHDFDSPHEALRIMSKRVDRYLREGGNGP